MRKSPLFLLGGAVLLIFGIFIVWRFVGGSLSGATEGGAALGSRGLKMEGQADFGLAEASGIAYDAAAPSAPVARNSGIQNNKAVGQQNNTERLIIKTANLSIVVDDVPEAIASIMRFVQEQGGFVVESSIEEHLRAPQGSITVRVPADIFDRGIARMKEFGDVKSERVSGQDVTEEYTDLGSRLKNLQATEAQLLNIMTRAGEIPDVLAVQRELTNVREQIEVLEGRRKYLRESAALSTITVYLSTNPEQLPVVDKADTWKPLAVIKDASRSLLTFGKGVANVFIWFVVYIPVWLVLGLLVWGAYRFIKRYGKTQI